MIKIQSHSHSYEVFAVDSLEQALQKLAGSNIFFLIDELLPKLYPAALKKVLESSPLITIPATEKQKTYEQIHPIFLKLIELGIKKDSRLIVIGGGVVQDIGCFIASILFRGIKWDLIPTTLLAQCDSCIGSKSSINIGDFKNQLGTFYPPQRVAICFSVLKTLPQDEIRSGIGEMIKLALIAGETDVTNIRQSLSLIEKDPSTLESLVMRSLQIKKEYIEKDEFDSGPRNLLNYGHTFGHAYESATRYAIPHGIAVLLGVATATYFSEKLDMISSGSHSELHSWILDYYRPFDKMLIQANFDHILSAMKTDKKNTAGKVNCILTRGAGKMEKVPLDLDTQITPLLKEFLTEI